MAVAKRIILFLLVNFLVIATISLFLNLFGIAPYLEGRGINYTSLLAFCTLWGMGGSFISLLLSKKIAIWSMGVKIIEPTTEDPRLARILKSVCASAEKAGLTTMPYVGIYNSPEVNAFATGPSKDNALVALSTGLFQRLAPAEVDGVIGHEVAHIANGDMVTMTLIQGIVNAFVMFLARVVAFALTTVLDRDREEHTGVGYGTSYLIVFLLETVFMFFGMIVIAWFSRHREFRADRGGAELSGKDKMIGALEGLYRTHKVQDPFAQNPAIQALKISNYASRFSKIFATHPTLQDRILRLKSRERERNQNNVLATN